MDKELLVYIDIMESPKLVGRLWSRVRNGKEGASFEYDREWINNKDSFSLEPALTLGAGSHHTALDKALFQALGDSAPDRWGRVLMRKAERKRAKEEKQTPRTLHEIDYLVLVNDFARQGALRFKERETGPFLTEYRDRKIPPMVEVGKLLSAAQNILDEKESDEDLKMLLAPGSSLGGAWPKASVIDRNGNLSLAKFPRMNSEISNIRWEAVALELATKAGLTVPDWQMEVINKTKPVLIAKRFDRKGARRIPFLSAMAMLNANDGETHSYLEIADSIRRYGSSPDKDMRELWTRLVFNILISNTDDHLRNHGFLWDGISGWKLSPAFDLNPTPVDLKPRVLSTAITDFDATASMALAFEVAPKFNISNQEAHKIASRIGKITSEWRKIAQVKGISSNEIDRMTSAFEHEDLKLAVSAKDIKQKNKIRSSI